MVMANIATRSANAAFFALAEERYRTFAPAPR
jgi:hypothetical protein